MLLHYASGTAVLYDTGTRTWYEYPRFRIVLGACVLCHLRSIVPSGWYTTNSRAVVGSLLMSAFVVCFYVLTDRMIMQRKRTSNALFCFRRFFCLLTSCCLPHNDSSSISSMTAVLMQYECYHANTAASSTTKQDPLLVQVLFMNTR